MSDWISAGIGVSQAIKKFRNENAAERIAIEDQIRKMQLDIQADDIKRERDFNFKNDPNNIAIEAKNQSLGEVIQIQSDLDLGLYDKKGKAEAIQTMGKKIEEANIGEMIIPNSGGMTYNEFLIETTQKNKMIEQTKGIQYNVYNRQAGIEQNQENIKQNLARNLPADATAADRTMFDKISTTEGEVTAANRVRGLPDSATKIERDDYDAKQELRNEFIKYGLDPDTATQEDLIEAKAYHEKKGEYYKTTQAVELTAQADREDLLEDVQPAFARLTAAGVDVDKTIYSNKELTKLKTELVAVKDNMYPIILSPKQKVIYDYYAQERNLPALQPEFPYIFIKESNYFAQQGDRAASREFIAESVFAQMNMIPDQLYNTFTADIQGTLKRIIRSATDDLQEVNQAKSVNKDGNTIIDKSINIDWNKLGVDFVNMPHWVKGVVSDNIITKLDDATSDDSVYTNSSNISQVTNASFTPEYVESMYPEDVFNKTPDANEVTIAAQRAYVNHADRSSDDKSTTMYTYSNDPDNALLKETMNWAQEEENYDIVQAFAVWGPTLYNNGSLRFRDSTRPFQKEATKSIVAANNIASKVAETKGIPTLPLDTEIYTKEQIRLLADAVHVPALARDPVRLADLPKSQNRKEIQTVSTDVNEYFDFLGYNRNKLNDAAAYGTNALSAGKMLFMSLDDTQIGSSAFEGLAMLGGFFRTFSSQLGALGETLFKYGRNEANASELSLGDFLTQMQAEVQGFEYNEVLNQNGKVIDAATVKDGFVTKVNDIENTFYGGEKDPVKRQAIEDQFQQGLRDIKQHNMTPAAKIAQQKMLHAALVFYAAAAFQGEGGKAISDGDRQFVSWALSYGTFSDPDMRKGAIAGLLRIIGRTTAINKSLASDDIREVWAAQNFNRYYGTNTLHIDEYPPHIRNQLIGSAESEKPFNAITVNRGTSTSIDEQFFGTRAPEIDTTSRVETSLPETSVDKTANVDPWKDKDKIVYKLKDGGIAQFTKSSKPNDVKVFISRMSPEQQSDVLKYFPDLLNVNR